MATMASRATSLLILADGRFPSGGHAHSGGVEEAVAMGRVGDMTTLGSFLAGRLATTGLVGAALAATAAAGTRSWPELDEATDARTSSPSLRAVSRRQGRQVVRAAVATWPATAVASLSASTSGQAEGPHYSVAMGAVASDAGLGPAEAAAAVAYNAIAGPASAAVRLLGLDPMAVSGLLGRMAPDVDEVVGWACAAASESVVNGLDCLPCHSAPLMDIDAQRHVHREMRLFAS